MIANTDALPPIFNIGNLRLCPSEIAPGAWLVRVMHPTGWGYDRMINVVECDEGRTLYLAGWVRDPLTPSQWQEAAAVLYPRAEWVVYDRIKHGVVRRNRARLRPRSGG